ncbi:MAG: acyl-CoA thioesterase [Myxococcota bacterium]
MGRFHERVMGVYFDDLDPYQILHNARYLLLFERTLGSLWQEMGFGQLQEQAEAMHLVRANHIQYDRPVKGTGDVRVRVWIQRLGRTSLTFGFRVMPIDEDVDYASGHRVVVHIDPDSFQAVPWDESFRGRVAAWVMEQGAG